VNSLSKQVFESQYGQQKHSSTKKETSGYKPLLKRMPSAEKLLQEGQTKVRNSPSSCKLGLYQGKQQREVATSFLDESSFIHSYICGG
jgi:hypothetical protein